MLPGPVFSVELTTTARRARYYALRTLYGLILLVIVWQNYESHFRWYRPEQAQYSIRQMSSFAQSTFSSFLTAQSIAVLFLTPALVAGVIADEKQRKTLHYLLASRLTSGEIVLGKLCARLLHLAVFVAIGLPVMSLLGLFGGVDPQVVTGTTAVTLTTAFFLAGLSVLISTFARRVREAVVVVFLLELTWLILPPLIEYPMKGSWPVIYSLVGPVDSWVALTNPINLLIDLGQRGPAAATGSPLERVWWTLGSQLACGVAFVALAVWRLRPNFRAAGAEGRRFAPFGRWRRWRLWRRPALGDAPMLWKERYVARPGGLVKSVTRVVATIALIGVGYGVYALGRPAFEELADAGYGGVRSGYARDNFNGYLRGVGTVIYCIWSLAVAAAAAGSVTSEREEDTWTSLTTTDLDGGEILGAKMIGAVWGLRPLGLALVSLWLIGLAAGSVHPFGVLAALLELAVFTWFSAALGTFLSLRARTTTRAMAATVGILIAVNGGYLMCCVPMQPDTPLILLGCTPAIEAMSLLSWADVWDLLGLEGGSYNFPSDRRGELVLACVLGVFVYGLAAAALTAASILGFDSAVDRPRYEGQTRPPKKGSPAELAAEGDIA
jgi:ABC-type transport system involved in multi-copper enzyme maturation permease subunit